MTENSLQAIIIGEGEGAVEVTPRKSSRARRISIKISANKGVELIIPNRISFKKAEEFLHSRKDWVISNSRNFAKTRTVKFADNAEIPVMGRNHKIIHSGQLRGITHINDDKIMVFGPVESIPRKVRTLLKKMAMEEIMAEAKHAASCLNVSYNKITLRDTSSRWGSCSYNKSLSFSWRLIMAPEEILRYVVVHEVAHLLEMNHSEKFWKIVSSLCPQYKMYRTWLRDNGANLHLYC